tara:strand:+ start:257 stop:655 length:399 start_codon:yes stop_codon:yes gene_type:complete
MVIGITASAFDILHAGHVSMLTDAEKQCDYLICCLHVDPSLERENKNKPIQSLVERYLQLKAVRCVDEIIPYQTEDDLINILHLKAPDVRIIGEEYRHKSFTGKDLTPQIYYNNRKHSFSSTEIRKRIKNER